jgi:hypothetical protein
MTNDDNIRTLPISTPGESHVRHLFILFASVTLAASTATAQPRLMIGQIQKGALSASSARLEDGSSYDLYRYDSPGNETIVILMESSDFDSYLSLGRTEYGAFTQLASDDDGGGGTNARIEHTIAAAGTYLIRANSLMPGETGSYTIRVIRSEATAAIVERTPIRVGQSVAGLFTTDTPTLEDGSHFAEFTLAGSEGQTVEIQLTSDDFDAYLWVGILVDGLFESIEVNDDGEDGTNARILFTFPDNQTYVIRANTLNEGETGSFTVRVTAAN